MSSKSLLMSPMDLQLPPTPPMDLSDSNSNSSNDYKVSFGCITKSVQLNVSHENARENKRGKFREPPPSCARLIRIVHWVTYPMPDAIAACAQTRSLPLSSQRALCKRFFHVHAIAKDASLNRPLNSSRTKHSTHRKKKEGRNFTLPSERPSESRERDSEKISAISLASTSIHSEHASISCVSREHFLFSTLNSCDDVRRSPLYLSSRSERKVGTKRKKNEMLYTPIECGFLVVLFVVVYARWGLLKLIQASASRM